MTSLDAPCGHDRIVTYRGGGVSIWACAGCSLRFYPACRTCVDVGHRNVEHPAADPTSGNHGATAPRSACRLR